MSSRTSRRSVQTTVDQPRSSQAVAADHANVDRQGRGLQHRDYPTAVAVSNNARRQVSSSSRTRHSGTVQGQRTGERRGLISQLDGHLRCLLTWAPCQVSAPTSSTKVPPHPLALKQHRWRENSDSVPMFKQRPTNAIMSARHEHRLTGCGCNYTRHAHRSGNVAAWTTRNTSPNNSVRDRSRGRSLWRLLLPWEGGDPKAPPLQVYDSSNSRPLLCAIAPFAVRSRHVVRQVHAEACQKRQTQVQG